MSKDSKGKPMSWLKGVIYNNSAEESYKEQPITSEAQDLIQESKLPNDSHDNSVFSKDNQDKVTLDLIVSMENMLKDRQLLLYKLSGLEEQLQTEKELTSRLKQDLMKKEQLVHEKDKEMNMLENKLTNKQMNYDQLLEDYKSYQQNSAREYEQISTQLETEINKYNKLNEESTESQYKHMLQIKALEEKIRELEVENQQYVQQYQRILDEKSTLMQTFNEFTERMTFSFSTDKSSSSTQLDE